MALKEKFLSYAETQRNARSCREAYGPQDMRTIEMYDKANRLKREVLDMIDEYEEYKYMYKDLCK